ncbi:hypothetical protein UFOVP372_47 [uncultured Caudovirales phage]|uniref:Pectate lyase superfamily protein n=1 Tax=uncultured Caudovirales phage TaxID=2100421 RepID=A0A6J7WYD5_9CAUD|nr:hypothetical protein UFOVP372_47 [uncultured Caudovirales phage]
MALTKVSYSMIEGACVNVFDFIPAAQIPLIQTHNVAAQDGAAIVTGINAALEYARLQGQPTAYNARPVVFMPAGTYRIADSIIAKDYACLQGEGPRSTTINTAFVGKSAIRGQYGENPAYADRTIGWDMRDFSIENSLHSALGVQGLAQGGSANTITLESTASAVDDYYVGWLVKLEGGPGSFQQANITAYNGTTKVATISGTFSPVPTSATRYRLMSNSIGLNMGSTGYSTIENINIVGYTICMYTTNNGYYNTWLTVKAFGYIGFWLESDGGANVLLNCESQFTYQGVRVDRGDFVMTTGSIESLVFDTTDGTAQAGGASTITLAASASSVNQKWTGFRILIESGTGAGQSRTISNYNGTTKVATVDTAWATQPDSTSTYHIGSAAPHACNYVGFGPVGTTAALKSVNVYYETYTRTSQLGDYGSTMFQCTLISPAKRGYASVLSVAVPSQFIVMSFLGDYTPFTRNVQVEFATAIQGSPTAFLRAPSGNQVDVYAQDNINFGYLGANAFCPNGSFNNRWTSGTGSPEGSVTASPGALYTNISGGAGTTLYVKEGGNGNTGWVGK